MTSKSRSTAVIISHYNAWPTDQLVALLDQIKTVPSGQPFHTRVVVNQAEDKPLDLPPRHADVEIFYRENVGYNIGAWDYGWRQPPEFDDYLFLQEECVILKPNWLRAFARAASRSGVGLVGESHLLKWSTWDDIDNSHSWSAGSPLIVFGHTAASWSAGVKTFLHRYNIEPGHWGEHLQAVVLFIRREVLDVIGGFPIGVNKDESICSELAITKAVQGLGLKAIQVNFLPFRYIHHPQWDFERKKSASLGWVLRKVAHASLPEGARLLIKRLAARRAVALTRLAPVRLKVWSRSTNQASRNRNQQRRA